MKTPVQAPLCHSSFSKLRRGNRGVTSVEYVIILVVVACLAIGLWKSFGKSIQKQVSDAQTDVEGLR